MKNNKPTRRISLQPLETGQIWRMAELNLKVGLVGKLLVHYKLAKPDAVRTQTSVSGKRVVEKYSEKEQGGLDSRITCKAGLPSFAGKISGGQNCSFASCPMLVC